MKVCVFTSNQARHLYFLNSLSEICDTVYAVQESGTLFPGKVPDFYRQSPVMQKYFSRVIEAEKSIFGMPKFLPNNVRQLALKFGDLSFVEMETLSEALSSDYFVVFGTSFIKGELCQKLIERKAVNIHMGISPYYRGSSCNFWAMYDQRPELVGGTVHYLSQKLDAGEILFHSFPDSVGADAFSLGMRAVESTLSDLTKKIAERTLLKSPAVVQNSKYELRYSANKDFTDDIAELYLANEPSTDFIHERCSNRENREKYMAPIRRAKFADELEVHGTQL